MRYGIPKYRLPRDILDAEIARILDMGVTLEPNTKVTDIQAELTATQYVGLHRYTFPGGAPQPTVMFDVSAQLGKGSCVNSSPSSIIPVHR